MARKLNIAVGRLWQETNSFSDVVTTLADFQRHRYQTGRALLEEMRDHDDELAGIADELDRHHVNYVPLLAANCWCGGPADQPLVDDLLRQINLSLHDAPMLDGVIFSLHGAMAGLHTFDVEGIVAKRIRTLVGPATPIVLTFDHHANITQTKVQSCDALTAYRHCPHTDMRSTGQRGTRMLLNLIQREFRPTMAYCKLPLVTPCECFLTSQGPMRDWFALAQEMERQPDVIDISLFPVQPWLNVPEHGWSVVVTTNQQQALAETLCQDLAQHAWDHREKFFVAKLEPSEAVHRAATAQKGPVVIADGADATNGGSPGDSTALLREMLRQEITCPVFLTMVDPDAVRLAVNSGIGTEIEVNLGAKRSARYHKPVRIRAHVERFSEGRFEIKGHIAARADMGRCALLRVGSIYIVTSEHPGPGHDPAVYRQIGLEPRDAQIIVVKATVGHVAAYAGIMTESLPCECPGPSPSYLDRLDYTRSSEPFYPRDRNFHWRASCNVSKTALIA